MSDTPILDQLERIGREAHSKLSPYELKIIDLVNNKNVSQLYKELDRQLDYTIKNNTNMEQVYLYLDAIYAAHQSIKLIESLGSKFGNQLLKEYEIEDAKRNSRNQK